MVGFWLWWQPTRWWYIYFCSTCIFIFVWKCYLISCEMYDGIWFRDENLHCESISIFVVYVWLLLLIWNIQYFLHEMCCSFWFSDDKPLCDGMPICRHIYICLCEILFIHSTFFPTIQLKNWAWLCWWQRRDAKMHQESIW